ncbi:MAG TPA: MMPL family transporter, partial [Kribbellaceae bacterium]
IIPAILGVIFVVLMLLLRSIAAAVLLVIANVLSFGATVGFCAVMFNHVFGFPGADPVMRTVSPTSACCG